ncbi:MAG: hypothetical protein ACI87E_004255 [Mariniblastus sp.]|jgi:hypothetical protein
MPKLLYAKNGLAASNLIKVQLPAFSIHWRHMIMMDANETHLCNEKVAEKCL